jgi:hypothetical protein
VHNLFFFHRTFNAQSGTRVEAVFIARFSDLNLRIF